MSTESKHTPGPWTVLTEGSEDDCITRTIMATGDRGDRPRNLSEVALVTTGSFADDIEDANARLIAAAPDLLEAAQKFVLHWEMYFSSKTVGQPPELSILKDAIKKAKGQ